jgi:hypothetical protein
MQITEIVLRDDEGMRIPSMPSVPITTEHSITFSADDGADTALYFSPATEAILSPQPTSPVYLQPGETVTYLFAEDIPAGAYGVIVQAIGDGAPGCFDFGEPLELVALLIQPGSGAEFGISPDLRPTNVPTNTPGT